MSCKKYFIAVLLSFSLISLRATGVSMFPFCAETGSTESERLNSFHIFFKNLNTKVKFENLELVVHDAGKVGCDQAKRRTAAIVANTEKFLKGTYMVKGDSVQVSFETLYAKFIDKGSEVKVVTGVIDKFDDLIGRLVGKICSGLDVSVTPDMWKTIMSEIKTDGSKYQIELNTESQINNFEIGKMAYESAKYSQSISSLMLVKATDEKFSEALFLIGKCYISKEEFSKALEYFSKAKESGAKFTELDEYITASKNATKPGIWFDNRERRLSWWNKLMPEETQAIITLMNNLRINNKTFGADYAYHDEDIAELFKTNKLVLKNIKIENFELFKYFTRTDVLILDNCKYTNANGLNKLYNLRIIRAKDKEIQKSSASSFIEENKIIVLITQ